MKIKLKSIDIIDENELLKRVEYKYSLDNKSGLLKIELTMYKSIDELEYFLLNLKHLYKYNKDIEYNCFCKNNKYKVFKDNIQCIKMY